MNTRVINTEIVREKIIQLIHQASFSMPDDAEKRLRSLRNEEDTELAKGALDILVENMEISKQQHLPLCQDCGMTIVFMELGQDVTLQGELLEQAVNHGVEQAYSQYYLRKSIVADPLRRINTGTNTPAFLHTEIVGGSRIKITVYLKGGGSENMSALRLFKPTDTVDTLIDFIANTVIQAGPNPCPPLFLGIGIGGTADTAVLNAKKAVLRNSGSRHPDPFYADLENRIEQRLNQTNVGPLGFGGKATAAGVFIKEAPCHIASLPVALNLNCHSLRFAMEEF